MQSRPRMSAAFPGRGDAVPVARRLVRDERPRLTFDAEITERVAKTRSELHPHPGLGVSAVVRGGGEHCDVRALDPATPGNRAAGAGRASVFGIGLQPRRTDFNYPGY